MPVAVALVEEEAVGVITGGAPAPTPNASFEGEMIVCRSSSRLCLSQ
jgi:hypothetical protein